MCPDRHVERPLAAKEWHYCPRCLGLFVSPGDFILHPCTSYEDRWPTGGPLSQVVWIESGWVEWWDVDTRVLEA